MAEALPLLKEARALDPKRSDIALTLAEVQIALNRSDDAEAILTTIPLQDQDSRYHGLVAQIELLKQAADTPEIQQLQNRSKQSLKTPLSPFNWRYNCIRSVAMKKR